MVERVSIERIILRNGFTFEASFGFTNQEPSAKMASKE
jgi:hypothetical protein